MSVNETSTLVHHLQRQFLSCGLCHERYTDPKVLPCLHSFCGHCLHAYTPAHSLSLTCPVCRHQSILPRDGVTALRSNYVIGELCDVIDTTRYCGECLEIRSAGRCLSCELELCGACAVEHVQRMTSSHCVTSHLGIGSEHGEGQQRRLLKRDGLTSVMTCANHDGETLSYYCSDCDTAVCRVCATAGEHQTPHRTVPLCETIDVHRQSLTHLLNETKEHLPMLKIALSSVRDVTVRLDTRCNEVMTQINESFDQLALLLAERRQELLSAVGEVHASKRRTLSDQTRAFDDVIATVSGSCEFAGEVIECGSEIEVLLVRKMLTDRMTSLCSSAQQVRPEENDLIKFDDTDLRSNNAAAKYLSTVGTLRSNSAIAFETTATGDALKRCWVNRQGSVTITTRDRNGDAVKVGGATFFSKLVQVPVEGTPVVVVVNGNEECSSGLFPEITDNNDGTYDLVYVIREPGTYRLEITMFDVPIRGSPFRVKAHRETDSMERQRSSSSGGGSKIPSANKQRGTKRPSSSRSQGSTNRKSNPIEDDLVLKGITCNGDLLVIADSNSQCIQVFSATTGTNGSTSGECVLRFGAKGRQVGQLQRPTGVAVTGNGNYLVADYDNKWVSVHGPDGKYINKIGGGKLLGPKGVCVDREGHIIVVDNKASAVFVFASNGRLLHKFGSRGNDERHLAGPHFCAVNIDNEILVTDFHNHCVKVYDIEGTFRHQFGSSGEGNGQFNAPTGIAVDKLGNIFVADWGNSRIQMFDSQGSFLSYVNTSADPLYGPQGLAVTDDGNVVVADSGNHCLKLYRHFIQ